MVSLRPSISVSNELVDPHSDPKHEQRHDRRTDQGGTDQNRSPWIGKNESQGEERHRHGGDTNDKPFADSWPHSIEERRHRDDDEGNLTWILARVV